MSNAKLEKKVISEIACHAHQFINSTYLSPRIAFTQCVLQKCLNLYFIHTKDPKLIDACFHVLYLKHCANALLMLSHGLELQQASSQKTEIEKKYQQLLFNTKKNADDASVISADMSWIDVYVTAINQRIDELIEDISKQLKTSKKSIEIKLEKLFARFHEVMAISIWSFQKELQANARGDKKIECFNKDIETSLQQYLHLENRYDLYQYTFVIAGVLCIAIAIALAFVIKISMPAVIAEISLLLIGALLMLSRNCIYDYYHQPYNNFF